MRVTPNVPQYAGDPSNSPCAARRNISVTTPGPSQFSDRDRMPRGEYPLLDHSTQVPTLAIRLQRSSGRSERLIRVTTRSQARFSACGYTKSKQCMELPAECETLHRLS